MRPDLAEYKRFESIINDNLPESKAAQDAAMANHIISFFDGAAETTDTCIQKYLVVAGNPEHAGHLAGIPERIFFRYPDLKS